MITVCRRITTAKPATPASTVTADAATAGATPFIAFVTLRGVPDLSDVRFMAEILRHQGAEVAQPAPGTWVIRAEQITHRTPYDLVRKMRASVCLLGALVGRLHQAEMAFGQRDLLVARKRAEHGNDERLYCFSSESAMAL